MALGLLGGSFDPVHHGHLIAAARAAEALGLDAVCFIPCAAQPLKPHAPLASAADRAAMLRLAIRGGADAPRLSIDTQELERPAPSYTVDTLRAIRAARPAERLVLLLGADAAAQLPRWREAGEIPRLAEIAVLTRPGAADAPVGAAQHVVATPAIEISASDIRARVLAGKSIRWLLPEAVADYIKERGLYR